MRPPPQLYVLLPGDWTQPTGGYRYDRRIAQGLQAQGWVVRALCPGEGFPFPSTATVAVAEALIAAVPDGSLVLADGLAFGALPALAAREAGRLRWVALVHHPLALETGLTPAQAAVLEASERAALSQARQVITTSRRTAADLLPYGVPAARIAVVEPGTDPAPLAAGASIVERTADPTPDPAGSASGASRPGGLQWLCVASLTPRKGHAVLIEALAGLRDRDWTLHCVGSAQHHPPTAAALREAVAAAGLADRVHWHGALDSAGVQARLAAADVFVLPSFHEGYGMALAEALACGLPVISTRAGAIPDTVPADAGVLLPPGDVGAWRATLARLIDDPAHRAALARGARAARACLPSWDQAAARMDRLLRAVPA